MVVSADEPFLYGTNGYRQAGINYYEDENEKKVYIKDSLIPNICLW